MESKQTILASIRRHVIPPQPAPDLDGNWIQYEDRVEHFRSVLESVGGQSVLVRDADSINSELARLPQYQSASKVYSSITGVGKSNVDLDLIDDPHDLKDVDFAIARAELGVAENGALWITDVGLKHRVVYFITQHLSLVIPASEIVNNMHDAYQRLVFDEARFGVFISGPSKTADIEQSLVIGAHGARSLTVFVIE